MTAGASNKEETLARLRSARGHLDAVIRMVEYDRHCIDVVHQIRAVQGGLDRSRRGLLEAHLRSCLPDPYATESYDTVTELLDAMFGGRPPRAGRGRCQHEAVAGGPPGNPECCAIPT